MAEIYWHTQDINNNLFGEMEASLGAKVIQESHSILKEFTGFVVAALMV